MAHKSVNKITIHFLYVVMYNKEIWTKIKIYDRIQTEARHAAPESGGTQISH
jgi:hypothetical protein